MQQMEAPDMKLRSKAFATTALAASLALFGTTPASAAILAQGSDPVIHESPGVFSLTVDSTATLANLSFELTGYNSLDGFNAYTDIFSLAVNGATLFFGTFNMGGGGYSLAWGAPGTTWTTKTGGCTGSCTDTTWLGGTTEVSLPISLISGQNDITFSYRSPGGIFAGGQTLNDESWTVSKYLITAVPEPETYAMLLAGLGIVGFMARRRKAS